MINNILRYSLMFIADALILLSVNSSIVKIINPTGSSETIYWVLGLCGAFLTLFYMNMRPSLRVNKMSEINQK